jgi:hypothetical protein
LDLRTLPHQVRPDVIVDSKVGTHKTAKFLPTFTGCKDTLSVDLIAKELAKNLTGGDGPDLPGRSYTKKMFRDQLDTLIYGTPEKVEKDITFFVDQMTSERVRDLIQKYVASLQKKK